ncbi:MAG: DUF3179 domain-containing protein [SAR324 cluster bacterium]|nr:DUF3179 domain-containing protein [SAR324 cluster bacterium]
MYRRELDGRVLTFGHAGILYERSFVMYDRQTQSLWVHVTGRAEWGTLKGSQLTLMPSTVTNWANWKESFPHTLVLPGHRRGGFMGTYDGISGDLRLGLVVVERFKAKLYPFRELVDSPVVNDRFGGKAMVIFYSNRAGTAAAWERTVDGRDLTFTSSESKDALGNTLLVDQETGSRWSWLTGEAVAGPMKGRRLAQLRYNPILNNRFEVFYPGAPIYHRPTTAR